jgi:hypothetical protein
MTGSEHQAGGEPYCRGDRQWDGYSVDGVDETLIEWMLSLTPTERLEVLQRAVLSLAELRHGYDQAC